jgi:cation transport regulator
MPYSSNNDLPDNIKNNLPEQAQNVYRSAFNSAYEKSKDDNSASQIAWGAVKSAGWTKDNNGNWKKNNSELKDVEIFSVGNHKGVEFTDSDLDEMVSNFNELREFIKPPLKLAHYNDMHKKDGQPALGWMTEVKKIGGKLLASFSNVPDLIHKAISKKLYKRVSSEIYPNLFMNGKKYKRVLCGAGICGADIPVVKNLKDIEILLSSRKEMDIDVYNFDVNDGIITHSEDNNMDKDLQKQYEDKIKLLETEIEATRNKNLKNAEITKYTEAISAQKDEIDRLKSQILKQDSDKKIAEFKAFCEKSVAEGKMFPAARDILMEGFDKMEFTEGQELTIPFDKFQKYMEKSKEILDKGESGFYLKSEDRGKGQVSRFTDKPGVKFENASIDKKATLYMTEHKVSYEDALLAVLDSDKNMLNEFNNAGCRGGEEG